MAMFVDPVKIAQQKVLISESANRHSCESRKIKKRLGIIGDRLNPILDLFSRVKIPVADLHSKILDARSAWSKFFHFSAVLS